MMNQYLVDNRCRVAIVTLDASAPPSQIRRGYMMQRHQLERLLPIATFWHGRCLSGVDGGVFCAFPRVLHVTGSGYGRCQDGRTYAVP